MVSQAVLDNNFTLDLQCKYLWDTLYNGILF